MDKSAYNQHISSEFNAEMEGIRQRVLVMGGIAEQQLAEATAALLHRDGQRGHDAISHGKKVNAFEVVVDDECARILARRQPTASDLRMVIAITRVIRDLERMGDEAEKIARMAVELSEQEKLTEEISEVGNLARHVGAMMHDALDALARSDVDLAVRVAREDQIIDREYEAVLRVCMTYMMEEPRSIRRVMSIIWAIRALERIGDHAKNIAEHVIYSVEGEDVRHVSIEEMERVISNRA